MDAKFIFLIGIALLFLGCVSPVPTPPKPLPTACTSEAKLCPDGTAVGRVGPHCEFAPCPIMPVVPVSQSKAYWGSTSPLAVIDWSIAKSGTGGTIIFENTSSTMITLTSLNWNGRPININATSIPPGESSAIANADAACPTVGEDYAITMSYTYDTPDLNGMVFHGSTPLLGKCLEYSQLVIDPVMKNSVTTVQQYYASIDYSCTADSDCAIKDVGNACGYYPKCTNKNARSDSALLQRLIASEAQQSGSTIGGACGFPAIDSCSCVQQRCVSMQGGHVINN